MPWFDILQRPADVDKTPPVDGDMLKYNAASNQWVVVNISSIIAEVISKFVIGAVPAETPNGVIVLFTVPDAYVAGTLKVYRDQFSMQPAVDFTETDEDAGTFTMTSAPLTGEVLWCAYVKQ